METTALIFAIATVTLALVYIIRIKRQINNVEKAFKELAVLYSREKDENKKLSTHLDNALQVKFNISGKDLIAEIERSSKNRLF